MIDDNTLICTLQPTFSTKYASLQTGMDLNSEHKHKLKKHEIYLKIVDQKRHYIYTTTELPF